VYPARRAVIALRQLPVRHLNRAVDGRPGHLQRTGDRRDGHAAGDHVLGEGALVRVDRGLTAADVAPAPGRDQPGHSPLNDQAALELGQRAEHVEHQAALIRGRVHALGQRPEPDPAGVQVVDDLDQVPQ
jgi:hypothetical protein